MTLPTSSLALGDYRILAVETSGGEGSLAYAEFLQARIDQRWPAPQIHQVQWNKKASHSEIITVKLKEILKTSSIDLSAITHISTNIGPGSFTGIRVGLSLARTLAYALPRPIVTLDRLSLLAVRRAKMNETVFVALKAVQNFYYCAGFERDTHGLKIILPHQSLREDELKEQSRKFHLTLVEGQESNFTFEVEAQEHLRWLAEGPDARSFSSWRQVKPLYIRGSEAEEKLRSGLLKPV